MYALKQGPDTTGTPDSYVGPDGESFSPALVWAPVETQADARKFASFAEVLEWAGGRSPSESARRWDLKLVWIQPATEKLIAA